MQDVEPKIKSAISKLLDAGFQISPATLELLQNEKNPQGLIDQFLSEETSLPHEIPIIKPEHLAPFLQKEIKEQKREGKTKTSSPTVTTKTTPVQQLQAEIEVIINPTSELASKGTLEDFVAHFQDRYSRLRQIISQRVDGKGIMNIQDVVRSYENKINSKRTYKIVGLITNKMLAKSGNWTLELEDPTGRILAVIPQRDTALTQKLSFVLLDQVLCVEGTLASDEMLIVKDLFLPDIPTTRRNHHAREDISAVLISDIHYGSRQFLEPVFQRFLRWLQGQEGDDEQKELASSVKYLVIAGDLVDGIGIYPKQFDDLVILDIDKQYSGLAELLQQIPKHIHIIIAPGNHDGVRNAIPRPSIPERFLAPLRKKGLSITSVGCPCTISLSGVNILIYHGDSLTDIMGALSKPELEASFVAMREMLRGRHLAPIYGKGTPIVAEPRDWLVIDQVPDILHCGHIHVNSVGSYRKTLIINSGTFQSQTDYQRSIGIDPTPGIISLVNLKNLNVKTLNFA